MSTDRYRALHSGYSSCNKMFANCSMSSIGWIWFHRRTLAERRFINGRSQQKRERERRHRIVFFRLAALTDMNAAEEITEDQARQFQLDLEICYNDFTRLLSSNWWMGDERFLSIYIFLFFACFYSNCTMRSILFPRCSQPRWHRMKCDCVGETEHLSVFNSFIWL